MKRTVVGAVLLLVLLAGGITSTIGVSAHGEQVARKLNAASRQAMAGNMAEASESAMEAWADWEKGWRLCAAVTDQRSMEQIDVGFAQLEIYAAAEEHISFSAVCVQLAKQVQDVGDDHGARWWNFL